MSNFPSGSPGYGLLVLRLSLTAAAMALAIERLAFVSRTPLDGQVIALAASGILWLLGSACFAVGFLTSRVVPLVVLAEIAMTVVRVSAGEAVDASIPNTTAHVFLAAVAAGVALTGPGAYSVDARRYGRREIVIPPRTLARDGGPAAHH